MSHVMRLRTGNTSVNMFDGCDVSLCHFCCASRPSLGMDEAGNMTRVHQTYQRGGISVGNSSTHKRCLLRLSRRDRWLWLLGQALQLTRVVQILTGGMKVGNCLLQFAQVIDRHLLPRLAISTLEHMGSHRVYTSTVKQMQE